MVFNALPDVARPNQHDAPARIIFISIAMRRSILKQTRRLVFLMVCALLAMGVWSVMADDAPEIPQVTIEKSAEGYTLPAELPEGIVSVTFSNQTETNNSVTLARLNPDVTPEALNEALAQGPMGALPLVSLVGGTDIEPGLSTEITMDLKAGTYVLLDLGENAPAPSVFEVADVEGDGAVAPEADVQVSLLDFAFSLPLDLKAGELTWNVQNNGSQWHEMFIAKIDDNLTVPQIHELVAQMNNPEAAPDSAPVPAGFVFPISAGEKTWFNLNLEPGTYLAVCMLPDFATGTAHIDHGMMQIITVTA
jgi:hypothetical protein